MVIRILLLGIIWTVWSISAHAKVPKYLAPIDFQASVCSADADTNYLPDFSGSNCEHTPLRDIDPQGRMIWIQVIFQIEQLETPMGLHLSGKLSSDVYLNGFAIGSNGKPGENSQTEIPGRMDVVIALPTSLLVQGENVIVLKASSHHGRLTLEHPIHAIAIGPVENPQHGFLNHYWPSLPTLGVFILAFVYFAISAAIGRARTPNIALLSMCGFAAAQLIAEVSRGLIAYAYPVHDIRLIAITVSSAGVGVSLSLLVASIFLPSRAFGFAAVAVGFSILSVSLMTGFDQKAATAMFAPMLLSLILSVERALRVNKRAYAYAAILSVFIVTNVAFLSDFLDVLFFYIMMAFLVGLLIEQALSAATDERARRVAEYRAERLEMALEQAQNRDETVNLSVKSLGKIETITADQIIQIHSADGYASIKMLDGRELLHSQSLSELEGLLPNAFLRVHRSHLVNVRYVSSLTRNREGNGVLTMSDGSVAPVSRRIMPSIRSIIQEP